MPEGQNRPPLRINPKVLLGSVLVLLGLLSGCAGIASAPGEGAPGPADGVPGPGLYVLDVVEYQGGRAASPAPEVGYFVRVEGGWMSLEPYGYNRVTGSWSPGPSQGYLLPVFGPGAAEDPQIAVTLSESTLMIVHKRENLVAYYLRR